MSKRKRNTKTLENLQKDLMSAGGSIDEIVFDEESGSDSDYLPLDTSDNDTSSHSSEITSSDVEDNADDHDIFVGKDGSKWSTNPPAQSRTPQRNIIQGPLQKVIHADHINNETDMFQLYITKNIMKTIVTFTNKEGRRVMKEKGKDEQEWAETDETELWALIGILLTFGHLKINMVDTDVLWSKQYGISFVRATMSQRRFKDLLNILRFDDKETRSQRRQKDKLAPIREIWEEFQTCLGRYYVPGDNLTVDEELVPVRGRCSFIQYIPAKPDKYGLKLFWLVDSSNCYPLRCVPYLGKEGRSAHVGLGRSITLELCRPYFHTNRNITADNFFTDHALALELLSNGLTLVGTVRQNKRFLPAAFSTKKARGVHDSVFAFQDKTTIVSYQCKRSKSVTLLSTMHKTADVDGSQKKKPEIVLYYKKTKGAVDTMDQMAHGYSTKRRTKRLPMVMFTNMIDVAGIASYTAWRVKFPQWNAPARGPRREFLQAIAEALMRPLVSRRKGMSISRQLQGIVQDVRSDDPHPSDLGKRRRCCICTTKNDRKSRQNCCMCSRNVCREHSVQTIVCMDCVD